LLCRRIEGQDECVLEAAATTAGYFLGRGAMVEFRRWWDRPDQGGL
jgi:hypothetical protein